MALPGWIEECLEQIYFKLVLAVHDVKTMHQISSSFMAEFAEVLEHVCLCSWFHAGY